MSGIPLVTGQDELAVQIGVTRSTSRGRAVGWCDALSAHLILFPTMVFAIHFLLVQAVGSLAMRHGAASAGYASSKARLGYQLPGHDSLPSFMIPFTRWDGIWFSYSARFSSTIRLGSSMEQFGGAGDALWPLLSWVMRDGARLSGIRPEIVGFAFVNLCLAGALIALYNLMLIDFDIVIARRALWCLVLFPTSFFFHAIYPEAVFLFFVAICLLACKRNHWVIAGLLGLLASLTRSQGILLIVPMLIIFFDHARPQPRKRLLALPPLFLPLLGPAIRLWSLNHSGMKWQTELRIQRAQLRGHEPIWSAFDCAVRGCSRKVFFVSSNSFSQWNPAAKWQWAIDLINHPSWNLVTSTSWRRDMAMSGSLGLIVTIGCLLLAGVGLFRLPLWMNGYVVSMLLLALIRMPALDPFDHMPRFALLLFPLAIVLATMLNDRLTRIILGSLSAVMLVFFTLQFVNWYWVA
jgi:hypothetical protein